MGRVRSDGNVIPVLGREEQLVWMKDLNRWKRLGEFLEKSGQLCNPIVCKQEKSSCLQRGKEYLVRMLCVRIFHSESVADAVACFLLSITPLPLFLFVLGREGYQDAHAPQSHLS